MTTPSFASAGSLPWACSPTASVSLAAGHLREIVGVSVKPAKSRLTEELQLDGYVRRRMDSPDHVARVVGRVQIGEVVETPIVFWTLLLRVMLPLAQASALLAGDADPVTAWDRWSRFLEFGGQFVLACGAAIILATLLRQPPPGAAESALCRGNPTWVAAVNLM